MRIWLAALLAAPWAFSGISDALARDWPPLPATGFISGRPATDQDVANGDAVFVLKAYGVYFGKPLDIVIPQYAYLTKRGDKPVPVIVIQAEVGKGMKIFGVRGLDGDKSAVRDYQLQLLGGKPPD
jgi:hypothetical protein